MSTELNTPVKNVELSQSLRMVAELLDMVQHDQQVYHAAAALVRGVLLLLKDKPEPGELPEATLRKFKQREQTMLRKATKALQNIEHGSTMSAQAQLLSIIRMVNVWPVTVNTSGTSGVRGTGTEGVSS